MAASTLNENITMSARSLNHGLSMLSTPGESQGPPSISNQDDLGGLSHARDRSNPPNTSHKRAAVLIGCSLAQLPIWGFAMSYGVLQEYFVDEWTLSGSQSLTGIIGTTSNGVMYLSMPTLFALFTSRWARYRQHAALLGTLIAAGAFGLSSLSTTAWHLVLTQGVIAAFGCALVYSPITLSQGEWYSTRNRALAYGVTLSAKNITGSTCPFLFRGLLDKFGFRTALQIWTGIVLVTSVLAILLVPTLPRPAQRSRKIPWAFLRRGTFWIYSIAIVCQSAGYGIPQTYLPEYAREGTKLSQTSATLLLVLFNIPGIASSSFFGWISDNKYFELSATSVTAMSAFSSAGAAFLLWGLTKPGSMALLVLFSIVFGFFAGGYSATWGGVLNEMENEAARANEAIDTGMIYGLLNGARGVGYVSGGLAGVPLLNAGLGANLGKAAYGSVYGPLIVFTGLSSVFGGWGVLFKCRTG